PWAEAIAVRAGRIMAMGSNADVAPFVGPETRELDLEGAFVMPGLHDMHTHPDLALAASYSEGLDVGIAAPTPDEIAQAIHAYAAAHPDSEWIHGHHWVHYTFREAGIRPGRDWLDEIMPDRPVAI